jgi:hypothetical protein
MTRTREENAADMAHDESSLVSVRLTVAELDALNTLCELELGSKEDNRIEAWQELETTQEKILNILNPKKTLSAKKRYTATGTIYMSDGFDLTVEAISEDDARKKILAIAYEQPWCPEIQEVYIENISITSDDTTPLETPDP